MVTFSMDRAIGRVVDYLKSINELDGESSQIPLRLGLTSAKTLW